MTERSRTRPPARPVPATSPGHAPRSLGEILGTLEPGDGAKAISVTEVLNRIGARSFGPAILVPALVMISPLSAIPSMPTLSGLLIALIALQALVGRSHLWLPDVLLRRQISAARIRRAIAFLEKPVA